jgi:hypothetical protein
MRLCATGVTLLLTLSLSGCFYVSNEKFRQAWDQDGDGWPLGEEGDPDADCAPFDREIYPFAPDRRGDGCDSDCGRETDSDGDDYPDDADCDPMDPTIFPCAEEDPTDGIDSDCDGEDTARTDTCLGLDPSFPDAEPIAPEDCPVALGGTAP